MCGEKTTSSQSRCYQLLLISFTGSKKEQSGRGRRLRLAREREWEKLAQEGE